MDNKQFKELIPYLIIIIVVILVKSFIVTPIRVNGASMYYTLHDKDIMLLNKTKYKLKKIERFDIVVIKYQNEYIIKRVIGLPGEKVSYSSGMLYINDKPVKEKFYHGETADFEDVKLKKNEYFVMGDNRPHSQDSRIIGPVNIKDILGHATFTIYPFNRFGNKK